MQWVDLLRTFIKEVEWERSKYIPMWDEYLENSIKSFAVGVLVPGFYLMGPKLPDDVIRGDEFNQLFVGFSLFGRILNDISGYQVSPLVLTPNNIFSIPLYTIYELTL